MLRLIWYITHTQICFPGIKISKSMDPYMVRSLYDTRTPRLTWWDRLHTETTVRSHEGDGGVSSRGWREDAAGREAVLSDRCVHGAGSISTG